MYLQNFMSIEFVFKEVNVLLSQFRISRTPFNFSLSPKMGKAITLRTLSGYSFGSFAFFLIFSSNTGFPVLNAIPAQPAFILNLLAEFQTLDGQIRKLDSEVLMICDAEKEIGIAGIMGGEISKITDDVKNVLFEAATFNGPNIRKASKRVGLRTDASGKFEKGLDPRNAEDAINRACQ